MKRSVNVKTLVHIPKLHIVHNNNKENEQTCIMTLGTYVVGSINYAQ